MKIFDKFITYTKTSYCIVQQVHLYFKKKKYFDSKYVYSYVQIYTFDHYNETTYND